MTELVLKPQAHQAGRLVVFEGDEGAGKSTQIKRFQHRLAKLGIKSQFIREPGGDPIAEQLRDIVKHSQHEMTALTEVAIFSAGRANVNAHVVKPLLQKGTWVLADRSYLSTLMHQGFGRGLYTTEFRQVVEYFVKDCLPDITIILDIPLSASSDRLQSRGVDTSDRFEGAGLAFRQAVNQGYRQFAQMSEYLGIDGVGSEEAVAERVWHGFCQWAQSAGLAEGKSTNRSFRYQSPYGKQEEAK